MLEIIIADNQSLILEGIQSHLHKVFTVSVVGTASNRHKLLALAKRKPANVIIISEQLPEREKAIQAVREINRNAKILIMVSGYSEEANESAANADGIVLANDKRDLIRAIHKVYEEGEYFPAGAKEIAFRSERIRKLREKSRIQLTPREQEVLVCIGDGMSNKEIAEHLHIKDNTVKSHRNNLRDKFSSHNTASLIKSARNLGFIK